MLNLLTTALLIFLPFQTQWIVRSGLLHREAWQYGTVGMYGTDVLLLLCIILILFKRKYYFRSTLFSNPYSLTPILVWAFLSILWSSDRSVAFMHALWVVEAFIVAWIVARSRFEHVAVPFIAGSVFQALVGLWQFFTQSTISSSIMGWAVHTVSDGGTSVIETVDGRWLRAYAGFPHSNMFGGWMAIAIILTIMMTPRMKVRWHWLAFAGLVILTGGLIVSFSRSAWLATMVGILILSFLRRKRQPPPAGGVPHAAGESRIVLIKIMIVTALTAASILLPYYSLLTTRFTPTARLEQKSIDERETGYRDALKIIRAHPMVGVGIGNYTNALADREPTLPVWSVQPVHNVFVLVLVELGIVGILFFMGCIYQLFKRRSAIFYPLFTILFILSLSDHYLWSLHGGLLLSGVVIGFLLTNQDFGEKIG